MLKINPLFLLFYLKYLRLYLLTLGIKLLLCL